MIVTKDEITTSVFIYECVFILDMSSEVSSFIYHIEKSTNIEKDLHRYRKIFPKSKK